MSVYLISNVVLHSLKWESITRRKYNIQIFSGSTGAANITVPLASVYYVVTVTATVLNGGDEIEGESSEGKLIYVPDPGVICVF